MAGRIATYAFVNAKIRTRISLLYDNAAFDSFEAAGSLREFLDMLAGSAYEEAAATFERTGDLDLCELVIAGVERELYREVLRYLDGAPKDVVLALFTRFEIENLKAALRLWFERHIRNTANEHKLRYLPDSPWPKDVTGEEIVSCESVEALRELFDRTRYDAGDEILAIPDHGSLFFAELALDRVYAAELAAAIAALPPQDRRPAMRIVGVQTDIENIRRIARLATFYELDPEIIADALIVTPGSRISLGRGEKPDLDQLLADRFPELTAFFEGRQSSTLRRLDLVESALEEALATEVRTILAGYPFTAGIVLSYFVLKDREIRRMIGILNRHRYGLSKGEPTA